jgi:O-methyltransferase
MRKFRKTARDIIINKGIGPLRPFVDAVSIFSKYHEWLKEHASKNVFDSREKVYDYLNSEVIHGEPIDFLEFGVWEGTSVRYWTKLNPSPASRFVGFDSFEGLPEDWAGSFENVPKGTFDTKGVLPVFDDPRVSLCKGWFQHSLIPFLKTFEPKNRLVIHCDADLYTSTLYVLCTLDHILKPGTIVMFDEFSSVADEFRALVDYSSSFLRTYKVLAQLDARCDQLAIELL